MRFHFPKVASREVRFDGMLLAVLVGSLAFNVYLGVERARPAPPALAGDVGQLRDGSQAPPFEAHDLKGLPVSLKYGGDTRDTLLYVFSPSCHWCERNRANLEAIVKTRHDLHIVGIALSGDLQQLTTASSPFDVTLRPTPATIKAYGLRATPTTILVSSQGKVIKEWPGAYTGPVAVDVSKVLAVSLPGLAEQ